MTDPLAARRGALDLIAGAVDRGETLSEASLSDGLSGPDRARALTLAKETMRRLGVIDAVQAHFFKRPPAPAIRCVLRLAGAEILSLGAAAHGAVDAAVSLTKQRGGAKSAGFVNAVARRTAAEGPSLAAALDEARLAAPPWLWSALRADWGKDGARRIAEAHLHEAPVDLTPKDGDAARWASVLGGAPTPTGSVRLARAGKLSALEGFADGEWWAQDAAAAVPARLAGAGRGRRALDLCAAPGGKTMQLAAAGWRVTALDSSNARMARLAENLARTGLSAGRVVADAIDWSGAAAFDLVLLDAPCTATGTIRRHPELPHIRDGAGLAFATGLQDRLLDAAWRHVAPGGMLIFATCSLFKAEGEARANAFLRRTSDAARAPVSADQVGDAALITSAGDFRSTPDLWPETGGLDGFFAARITRRE